MRMWPRCGAGMSRTVRREGGVGVVEEKRRRGERRVERRGGGRIVGEGGRGR